jgi:hypothetical protein
MGSLRKSGVLEQPKKLAAAYGRLRRAGFAHDTALNLLRQYSELAATMEDWTAPEDDEI